MYARCPEQYRRRYVEGQRIPPGIALLRGSAVHTAAEQNNGQKVNSHEDLPVVDLQDIAAEAYDIRVQEEGVYLQPDEKSRAKDALGEGKDAAVGLAGYYGEALAPQIQPVEVEQRFTIELPGLCDLMGVIDVVDTERVIRDMKTSGKRKAQRDADTNTGLTVYGLAYETQNQSPPAGLRLDTLIRTKSGKHSLQHLDTERTHAHYGALLKRLTAQVQAISLGSFPPTNPANWWCGPRWCGYYHTCPYRNGS